MAKSIRVPHSLVLLYGIVVFAYALTWILPAGEFETTVSESGSSLVVPGTFTLIEEQSRLPVWQLFTVIPRGLAAAQGIIFFVFIIGGALAIIRSTGAIDAGLGRLLVRFGHRPALLIFVGMLAFASGASAFGMAEENIPLTVILLALCLGMRLDAVTAVAIIVVSGAIGYGAAAINPFTVVIAQDIAGLPLISGLVFRLVMFVPFFAIGFFYVWRYAKHVLADPSSSLVAGLDEAHSPSTSVYPELTRVHWLIISISLGALVLLVWGVIRHGWYLSELTAIFFALAILVGLVARLPLGDIAKRFTEGAAELAGTALLIGVARSIEIMLSDGQVLHTIVNGLATPLTYLGAELSGIAMLLIQSLLNFFIPSGSGQAFVTMPIMAPIADIAGVSRQVAVLAYQMGDGITNMIAPTNAVLMSILGIAGVPYSRWFRFVWPVTLILVNAGALSIVIAILIGYA